MSTSRYYYSVAITVAAVAASTTLDEPSTNGRQLRREVSAFRRVHRADYLPSIAPLTKKVSIDSFFFFVSQIRRTVGVSMNGRPQSQNQNRPVSRARVRRDPKVPRARKAIPQSRTGDGRRPSGPSQNPSHRAKVASHRRVRRAPKARKVAPQTQSRSRIGDGRSLSGPSQNPSHPARVARDRRVRKAQRAQAENGSSSGLQPKKMLGGGPNPNLSLNLSHQARVARGQREASRVANRQARVARDRR